MQSLLPSTLALGTAALVALLIALSRRSPPERSAERHAAARALAVAIGVQAVHFAEEAATGFHERFGALFGAPAMPFSVFIAFNLACLGMWTVSIPGVRSARIAAFVAAWFLAIAGALNGVAHPAMAIASGGYFPGLVTSPLIGVAGVRLWRRLLDASRSAGQGL